jgi:large subunit ribosomal protein L32
MGVPKKRTSKMRRDRRRANWKATAPTVGTCPRCKEPIQPHRACASCGYYRTHEVIEGTAD